MRIAEVMSKPVRVIPGEEQATTAWEQMRLHRTRHLVVTGHGGQVVGVISSGDLGGRHGESVRTGRRVYDLMSEPALIVTPETTVREAANVMRGHRIGCLPVLEGSKLRGLVTATDLLDLIGEGQERPVPITGRHVMKMRGPRHRVLTQAKLASQAKAAVRRAK
jgi:acetoin utilization protein AcuB